MIRKAVLIGGGTLLAGVFVFGPSAVSYVRTSAGYVTDTVQQSVPVEFQIDRARGMLKNLAPEVRKNMHVIAKEEVEVRRLEEQIDKSQERLGKDKEQLMRLKTDLASDKSVFNYAGRSYTAEQVRVDLANRFERFKTGDATLASLTEIRHARIRSLDAARQKLEGMLAAKQQLEVEVENLDARLQMIAAAQTTSEFQFDDSRLGQVKGLISDLRTRLDVAEKLVSTETQFYGEIPLEEPTPENIADEVAAYFGETTPEIEAIADASTN